MTRREPAGNRGVALRTLGCKVNRAESETITAELLCAGVELADGDEAAVVVINTCTVTGEADAKARKAVRQALAAAGRPQVVVTGCLAALDREALRALGERVVVEADKSRVARVVSDIISQGAGECGASHTLALPADRPGRDVEAPGAFRTRVALKIQDGCDAFCSYCIVPYARGVPRATPLAEVRARAEALAAGGTREIVLTGINVGRYDDRGADLADVIAAVAQSGVARVRLSSVEPLDLTDRLLATMAATPSFCAHLHVPLQAGDDGVLAQMGRGYTTRQFSERIEAAREALPGLVVTTDVLAGFPGESAEQAAGTLAFCEQTGFGKLHVFRYSRRPGTPAAERDDQVAEGEKALRAAALRELSSREVAAHAEARLGGDAEVLVERLVNGDDGTPVAEGTTRDYLRVRFADPQAIAGELAVVRLEKLSGDRVLGERLG